MTNRIWGRDSSFHYVSFGMTTVCINRRRCLKSLFLTQRRKENAKGAKGKHLIINSLRALRKIFAPLRLIIFDLWNNLLSIEIPVIPNGAKQNEESVAFARMSNVTSLCL